jgi:signal transduction histidine kinase|tara:strand:- start:4398 stop:5783 length:1386 start_codon:yes stop_codon:yes gene_type:complete
MNNESKSLKTGFQVLTVISTLLVFGGAIWLAKEQMGGRIREQVLARYAQELYAISLVHQVTMVESAEAMFMDDASDQLTVYGGVAELSGALGVRLYTADGEYLISSPENIAEGSLSAGQFESARSLVPLSVLNDKLPVEDVFWEPLLEGEPLGQTLTVRGVIVPVHVADEDELLGVAQFLFDGSDALADIDELNDGLFQQGVFIFAAGSSVIALLLSFSFARINRIHRSLVKRTFALKRANQELALSNRTSAVGGVASHLIHGLRNPLAGLRAYLDVETPDQNDLSSAQSAAKRMEEMVDNIVRTLGEDAGSVVYRLSITELLDIFQARIAPIVSEHRVKLTVNGTGDRELDNREGNLILLILENLTQNALEACEQDGLVTVRASETSGSTVFDVSDTGHGLPETMKGTLFQPGQTSKEQGSGLGLAISGQLAASMGAKLALTKSNENGTTFRLTLGKRND